LPLKEEKLTTVNVLRLLLSHFLHLFFTLTSAVCVEGAQEYFLPQSAGYPSYATVLTVNTKICNGQLLNGKPHKSEL